ncbi:hypothetical protein Sjap_017282 [Stephania japonica]|uniref:Uncharacterized protein n=1 Tax=Stephania japonica TaxID=461633 RepID=A0AAP0NI49_9MAGN
MINSSPTVSDPRAASSVGMDRSPGPVTVVGVVGPAGARRAGDSVGRQSSIGDIVVSPSPEQRSPPNHPTIFIIKSSQPLHKLIQIRHWYCR